MNGKEYQSRRVSFRHKNRLRLFFSFTRSTFISLVCVSIHIFDSYYRVRLMTKNDRDTEIDRGSSTFEYFPSD